MDTRHKKELIEAGFVVAIAAGLYYLLRQSGGPITGVVPSSFDTTPLGPQTGDAPTITYNYPAGADNNFGAPVLPASSLFFGGNGDTNISGGNSTSTSQCGCCTSPSVSGDALPTVQDQVQQLSAAPHAVNGSYNLNPMGYVASYNPLDPTGMYSRDQGFGGGVRLSNGVIVSPAQYNEIFSGVGDA